MAAGQEAQDQGFEALCLPAFGDYGVSALRSLLDIPVVAGGRGSMLHALTLAGRFGIVTEPGRPWPRREAGTGLRAGSTRAGIDAARRIARGGGGAVVRVRRGASRCLADGPEARAAASSPLAGAGAVVPRGSR